MNPDGSYTLYNHRGRRTAGKYRPGEDPTKNPAFPARQPEGMSRKKWITRVRYHWDAWNRVRQNQGLVRVMPPQYLVDKGLEVTMRPPLRSDGTRRTSDAIGFGDWLKNKKGMQGPLIDGFNRQREQQEVRDVANNADFLDNVEAMDISDAERKELEQIANDFEQGGITFSDSDFDDQNGAGPSRPDTSIPAPPTNDQEMASSGNQAKRPRTDPSSGFEVSDNPTPAPTVAAGKGHNSSSDGGFDSAQGPQSFLPSGGYKSTAGQLVFTKVHRMKSWAIPYINLTTTSVSGGANIVTTPLAKIPWEYAFLYLSPEEFQLIPAGSRIDSVHVKIMHTVSQTGYPTGGTEAGVATANHPKVLIIGRDLEKKCRGGIDRRVTIGANMIPTATANTGFGEFIDNAYGTDQTAADNAVVVPGAATKIPYYNKDYFCIYQPNRAQAIVRNFFTEDTSTPPVITENNAPGFEYFQNMITEVNSNDVTWDYVDQMSYKFSSAPIGEQFQPLEIQTNAYNNQIGNAQYYNAQRNVTGTTVDNDFTITETIIPSQRSTIPLVTYESTVMEKGACMVRGDSANKPARQPSYHIGMRAIEKNTPDGESRASEFVQANIEFEVECTMIVKLPHYPNRFIKPKFYNTSHENAAQGIGRYPESNGSTRLVTFGLYNSIVTPPTLNVVDEQDPRKVTESGMVLRHRRDIRETPKVPAVVKRRR